MKTYRIGHIAIVILVTLTGVWALAAAAGYHQINKYTFGAAEGSTREYFDYITVDSAARRVYLSHGTEIKVIDADSGAVVGNITGLKQDHGVAIATEFGRGFITDGGQGTVIDISLPKYSSWPSYKNFPPMNIERYYDYWNRGIARAVGAALRHAEPGLPQVVKIVTF